MHRFASIFQNIEQNNDISENTKINLENQSLDFIRKVVDSHEKNSI